MYSYLFMFIVGIVILLFCTQKLVEFAKDISQALRISPLIIGITVVAIGTSLPELAVSVVSVIKHDTGLAIGNIIGSNIVNIFLVFPIGLFVGKIRIGTTKTQRNTIILLGATVAYFIAQSLEIVKPISGFILISLAITISVAEYVLGIFGRTREDTKQFKSSKDKKPGGSMIINVIFLIFGIVIGSVLIVNSVEAISLLTGISTTILGLTLIAAATSLPELLTTVFSQKGQQEKLTIGNILGSNIYNLLLIGGIISLFPSTSLTNKKDWLWLGIATVSFVIILRYYKGKRPPRWIGVVLFLLLFVYLLTQNI